AAIAKALAEPARTLVQRLEAALAGTAARPRRRRTLADQMLLRGGVLEWVDRAGQGRPGQARRWVGIGEPAGPPPRARGPPRPRGSGSAGGLSLVPLRVPADPQSRVTARRGARPPGNRAPGGVAVAARWPEGGVRRQLSSWAACGRS